MINPAQFVIAFCFLGASIIHLLPVIGLLGAEQIKRLYGIEISDPNLILLMRHRAILFGLLGLVLFAAIFKPEMRLWVIAAALVSTLSFVVLVFSVPEYKQTFNSNIMGVIKADIVAIVFLTIAAVSHYFLT